MKSPRIASLLVLVSMAIPLVAQYAAADDFAQDGTPSAEILDKMSTDDVPAVAPDNGDADQAKNSQETQDSQLNQNPPGTKDDGNTLPESTPPAEKAAPRNTGAELAPTGIPVARF